MVRGPGPMPGNRMRAWAPGGGWPSAKRLARPATYQPYSQVQPLGGAPFAAKGPAGPGGAHRPEATQIQAKDHQVGCREASRSLETPRKFFAQRPRIKTGAVRALRARLDRWRGPTPPEESNPQVKPPARNIRGGLTWGLPNKPVGSDPASPGFAVASLRQTPSFFETEGPNKRRSKTHPSNQAGGQANEPKTFPTWSRVLL